MSAIEADQPIVIENQCGKACCKCPLCGGEFFNTPGPWPVLHVWATVAKAASGPNTRTRFALLAS